MNSKKVTKVDLEKALTELENLTEQMESGKLSLEESLELFEKGVTLAKSCQKTLAEAELKVQNIIKSSESNELPETD